MKTISVLICFCLLVLVASLQYTTSKTPEKHCEGECLLGPESPLMNKIMPKKEREWDECAAEHKCPNMEVQNQALTRCVNGMAGAYPCCNVDLQAFINLPTLGAAGDGNDVWGWTDPLDGREYAIIGVYDGTSYVDITTPASPAILGFLKTHTVGSNWRDIKVYKNHAFIVSEARTHGMQVFDLTQLRNLPRVSIFSPNFTASAVPQLTESAFYGEFGNCHNIAINEDSGYAYGVGSGTCRGGLHMVDIRVPLSPKFAGCFDVDGYVHDTQCVNYKGPDTAYQGREICFCYDEDTLTIADVTVKTRPVQVARISYTGYQYTHQGWLNEAQTHLFLDDELDELNNANHHTRTMYWDVTKLSAPKEVTSFYSKLEVIDHNQYVLGDRLYQANYCGGLRILDISKAPTLSEVAYFDVSPDCQTTRFLGSWSNYPYFPSGTIVVSSIDRGLFVLTYNRNGAACPAS